MGIEQDKNKKWPDNSGYQFDLPPANIYKGRGNHEQERQQYYGASYVENTGVAGAQQWGNWTEKIEPDVRFAAISDKNAYLKQFPEVDAPWKFTEYIFQGTQEGVDIVEPPLFSPKTLANVNGIHEADTDIPSTQNDMTRTGGVLDGDSLFYYETKYKYRNKSSNRVYKEETLDEGVLRNGVRSKPWICPYATDKSKERFFKRVSAYKKKVEFKYPSINKGVRLYRKDVEAASVKSGQHGNIPSHVLTMSAPAEYFEPNNLYQNVIVPKITMSMGSPVIATTDGTIIYSSGNSGISKAFIYPVQEYVLSTAEGVVPQKWSMTTSNSGVLQPIPSKLGDPSQVKIEQVATGYENGDLVHKGCSFWKGDSINGAYCSIEAEISEGEEPAIPNPSKCTLYPAVPGSVPKVFYAEQGGECPYYQEQGPQEIALFEAQASTRGEMSSLLTSAETPDDIAGQKDLVNGKSAMSFFGSSMGGGTMSHGAEAMGAWAAMMSPVSLPREMGETDLRMTITYEFKKILAEGRETFKLKWPDRVDFENIVRGTGKLAFDLYNTGYGGIEPTFFGDKNLMSAHRFNANIMPCYNPEKCNNAYGQANCSKTWISGTYADVDSQEYCRYYNFGCPATEVPRRAYEYDRNYMEAKTNILLNFRESGINGFDGLNEYEISSGVYAAIGSVDFFEGVAEITSIPNYPSTGEYVYFYYNKSSTEIDHKQARVFVHIKQYNHEAEQMFMNISSSLVPEGYPEDIPWLVELHDDYVSPVKYETFIDNKRPFIGGRHPEYKDMSKRKEEVLCPAGVGGSIYGNEADSTRGGDPNHNATQDKGYYMGYWIDKTGEYIVDGRGLGGDVGATGGRVNLKPKMVNGATPIAGATGNTIIAPDGSFKARPTKAWVYSSDTREKLNSTEMDNIYFEDDIIPVEKPPEGCLPTERSYYRCDTCSSDAGNGLNALGEPIVNQIFTDYEVEHFVGYPQAQCPRCSDLLSGPFPWTSFPEIYAHGVVNIWGLPGQAVRKDGYYWRNPTLVSRALVTEMINKLGVKNINGGGYSLEKNTSANALSEGAVDILIRPSGSNMLQGLPEPSGQYSSLIGSSNTNYIYDDDEKIDEDEIMDGTYQNFSYNPRMPKNGFLLNNMHEPGEHSLDNKRLGGGNYRDDVLSPYDSDIDGLDMITINHLKRLRNAIQPMYAYTLEDSVGADFYHQKQTGHKERFTSSSRDWEMKPKGLSAEVIAASSSGRDQYDNFWDGTISPGTIVYYYWPTGPTWWRKNWCIGGISRDGGENRVHMDKDDGVDDTDYVQEEPYIMHTGYTGDHIYAKSYHFIQGWLPMDKEIVGAYAITEPTRHPDQPEVGVTWSGRILFNHYHAMPTIHDGFEGDHHTNHSDENWPHADDATYESESETTTTWYSDSYRSYMYDMTNLFFGTEDTIIAKHVDTSYGYGMSQDFISWGGWGTDIIQEKTDEEIWKRYTFEEMDDMIKNHTIKGKFVGGDPTSTGIEFDITLFSKNMLNKTLNMETQPIPGYFNVSGMNDKLLYPKTGPVFEEQNINTAWANDGQVIVQATNNFNTNKLEWSSGGLGAASGGWRSICADITEIVKERYDARVDRVYKLETGKAFSELAVYVKNEYSDVSTAHPPSGAINYRYWLPNSGFWLSDPWHYPVLVNDKMPTVRLVGDEYLFNPEGRVPEDMMSGFYVAPGLTTEDVGYYDYHPKQLIKASGDAEEGSVPLTGGKYWYVTSQTDSDQFFAYDLRSFPIEWSRRDYRYEEGHWDVSNTVCPTPGCYVHERGLTVAQYVQYAESKPTLTVRPSLTGEYCAGCGRSLGGEPGSIYVGGDGITTVGYKDIPEEDVFITNVKVSPNLDYKHGFSIEYRTTDRERWRTLFYVEWNSVNSKWKYYKYNDSKQYVAIESTSLPASFDGVWVNGSTNTSSADELDGAHFLSVKARYVRYRAHPKRTSIYKNPYGALQTGTTIDNKKFTPGVTLTEGKWQGGWIQFCTNFSDTNAEILAYSITANDDTDVYVSENIFVPSSWKWRFVHNNTYVSSCSKFEVYGYDIRPGEITMTGTGYTDFYALSYGVTQINLDNFPTKLTGVYSGFNGIISMELSESDTQNVSSFYWTTSTKNVSKENPQTGEMETSSYEVIVAGKYFFDPRSVSITVPGKWKNPSTGTSGSIWSLISDDNSSFLKDLPSFLEVNYFMGNGTAMETTAEAIGTGPSYIVEKEAICNLVGYENFITPAKVTTYMSKVNASDSSNLPNMGTSVKISNGTTSSLSPNDVRKNLYWQIYNHEKMDGDFNMSYIYGNEMGKGEYNESDIDKLFGGRSQEYAGLDPIKTKIQGKAKGNVTLYGLPNIIVSGNLYCYAKAITERRYIIDSSGGSDGTVVTYERTGGLKYTGFALGFENFTNGFNTLTGRRGMCFSVPKILVYMKERDNTVSLESGN